LSEIFYQSRLLKLIRTTSSTSDDDLGTYTGKIINGKSLQSMHIVSKEIMLKTDMKESDVVSDLMEDFPPISKEDNPEVLVAYVLQYYQDIGDAIAYSQILDTLNPAPLRIAKKRKSKKVEFEEEAEVKPKKAKKDLKVKVSETTLPDIQEEIADFELVKVLNKRSRGGSSKVVYEPK